jgi:hypothetical protein
MCLSLSQERNTLIFHFRQKSSSLQGSMSQPKAADRDAYETNVVTCQMRVKTGTYFSIKIYLIMIEPCFISILTCKYTL